VRAQASWPLGHDRPDPTDDPTTAASVHLVQRGYDTSLVFPVPGGNADVPRRAVEYLVGRQPRECLAPRDDVRGSAARARYGDSRVRQEDPCVSPDDPRARPQDPRARSEDPRVSRDDPAASPDDPRWRPEDLRTPPEDPRVRPQDPHVDEGEPLGGIGLAIVRGLSTSARYARVGDPNRITLTVLAASAPSPDAGA
jgi:hypothetical protein